MKDIEFIGSSLEIIKDFPLKAKRQVGHELDRVQRGQDPSDWKPMKSIGTGVKEIRVKDKDGIYRVIYVVKYLDLVHVLHAFQKTTQQTAKNDLDLAKKRLKKLIQEATHGSI